MKRFLMTAMSAIMALSLMACTDTGKEDEKKVSEGFIINDQAGRKVNFDKPAEKAISGYYIATSTVIGLGQKDKLVGVEMKADQREIYKQAAPEILELPAMGNKKSFNVEAAIKTRADVAFLPIALKSYVGKLEDAGMKVILLNPETQTEYDEAVNLIAIALGAREEAQNYFNYRDVLMEKYITDTGVAKKVYMSGSSLLEGAGSDMFQNSLLKSAKAENVMAKAGKGWSTIGKETLLDMNPDVIFLENGGADVKSVLQDSALSSLNAVKKKQVYEFPSPLETWDTPNLSSCLGALWAYATLYPDNLSMDTVKQEAKDFYRTFYHIEVKDSDLGL